MTLPRFSLGVLPTPLMPTPRLAQAIGVPEMFVKRDDLTGFGMGGNKVRKLEFLLGDALETGCDYLVVMGGPSSNLARSTALAARVAGLGCELVLYGDEPSEPPTSLSLARRFGAATTFTGDPERASVDAVAARRADELRHAGSTPYVIPRGGATGMGAVGYHRAVAETAAQISDAGIEPAAVAVTVGSGGTLAGIVSGLAAAGLDWPLVGLSVSREPAEAETRVATVAAECAKVLGTAEPRWNGRMVDARGPGYGHVWEPAEGATRVALETEGLVLDPTYTAKSMAAVMTLAAEIDGTLVWWHTGGGPVAIDHLLKETA